MEPQFHSLFRVGNISVILPHARMLSYRAENIHERLEPQELYEREEMEEAVQIEVCRNSVLMFFIPQQALWDQDTHFLLSVA